jgi:hypothetical protein
MFRGFLMPQVFRRLQAGTCLVLLALATPATAQFVYDREWPLMGYGKQAPNDPYSQLMRKLAASGDKLPHDAAGRGYLDGLLQALDIDTSSQVLVFSKSSLKQRFIEAANPRSLFFTDEVYVGFVPGSNSVEIAAMDPLLGPVFFDVRQDPQAEEPFKQETTRCLRCHDSYSMTGDGVPRFMLSSVISGPDGNIVSHELSEITDMATPIEQRFGGWFVTGTSGKQIHLGNFLVTEASQLATRPWQGVINQTDLTQFVDLAKYPRQTSDIVALLVLQHQVDVQNRFVRLQYESRKLLDANPSAETTELQALIQPVLAGLFMADEAPLADRVEGTSGYREWFEQRGPIVDGKSLRQFDLQGRTFRYRLSYLIYSAAIDGFAEPVRNLLFRDIAAVLDGDTSLLPGFVLPADERAAIKAILQATKPEVLAAK